MLLQALIWLSLLLAATTSSHHKCLPYPERTTCLIDLINYGPGGNPITFPTGYDYYETASRSSKQIKSYVFIFDEALYEAMHRPSGIEMIDVRMVNLTLPPELHVGKFADNFISSVTVKTGQSYQISYLDLESNNLERITFVSNLVNLEILHLESNQIATIPGSALAPLTKLKYLYLEYNNFTTVPWTDLPRTLILVDCYHGHVESTDFTNVSLPSLEFLGLQHNALTTINVTALLRAAPRLTEAHLHSEGMTSNEIQKVDSSLTSNNISFVGSPWSNIYCYHPENNDDDDDGGLICIRLEPEPVSTGMAILQTAVVTGSASVFVYIVVLVFRYMNR